MRHIFVLLVALMAGSSYAWDGYDQEKGTSIEIEKGNLVRSGEEIEYYDHGSGEYRNGAVDSIQRFGSTIEVEVTDSESGEVRTFEMED